MTTSTVCVKLLGVLERLAGRRVLDVEVGDGATVLDALETAATRLGPAFASAIFGAPGRIHTHVRVFVDGEEAAVTSRLPGGAGATELALLALQAFEGGSR